MSDITTTSVTPPPQTRPPRSDKRSGIKARESIAKTGNTQLDATIAQAKGLVRSVSSLQSDILAAVPAAIDAETDILLEGRMPQIEKATNDRIAAQGQAIDTIAAQQRDKAKAFLNRHGVVG